MADRHETRGWGAGERRMERRRAAADLAREEARASDRSEYWVRTLNYVQATREEETATRQAFRRRLECLLEESEASDRRYCEELEVQKRQLEAVGGELRRVSGNIAAHKAAALVTQGENQQLRAELAASDSELASYVAEVHEERRQKNTLETELREALRNIAEMKSDDACKAEPRDHEAYEQLVATAVRAAKRPADCTVKVYERFHTSAWNRQG